MLLLKEKLPLNRSISKYFKNINWNELNKKHKKDYTASFNEVIDKLMDNDKILINK